jgi:hypothetical protein
LALHGGNRIEHFIPSMSESAHSRPGDIDAGSLGLARKKEMSGLALWTGDLPLKRLG